MPRRWLTLLAIIAVTTAVVIGVSVDTVGPDPSPQDAPEANVPFVVSQQFDFDLNSLEAQHWTTRTSNGGSAALVSDAKRSGDRSLLVRSSAESDAVSVERAASAVVPGMRYDVSGFAFVSEGEQELSLAFADASGRVLASSGASTGATRGVWSRVTASGTAPPSAVTARLRITGRGMSVVHWDDLSWTSPRLWNGGFESAGPSASAAGWVSRATNAAVVRKTYGQRTGSAALSIVSHGSGASYYVTSPLVGVTSSIEIVATAWVRQPAGQSRLAIEWLDAGRGSLSTTASRLVQTSEKYERIQIRESVPDGARFAKLSISGEGSAPGVSMWDDINMEPAPGAGPVSYDISELGRMDGFLNTTTSRLINVGGRPKIYTIVSGDPAQFQLADLQTGELEVKKAIPGLANGWAMTNSVDEASVFFGGGNGHVWRYDTASRGLIDLGRATTSARVVFDLQTAPDGTIWGGSYPRGELWKLDPSSGRFTSLGTITPGQDYVRSLAVDANYVYVGSGSVRPDIVRISVADPLERVSITIPDAPDAGFVTDLDLHGRYLAARLPAGHRRLYDLVAKTWKVPANLDPSGAELEQTPTRTRPDVTFYYLSYKRLWAVDPNASGPTAKQAVANLAARPARDRTVLRTRIGGVLADWLITFDGAKSAALLNVSAIPQVGADGSLPTATQRQVTIQFTPNSPRIKSLGAAKDGTIYTGGFGGASLSVLDPSMDFPSLVPRLSDRPGQSLLGEIEGMASNGKYEYFGSYTSARIFRLDTTKPWVDGENPALVATLGPSLKQDRPLAWATSGPITYFGTIPKYGHLGGALGWFTGESVDPEVISSPAIDQSIVSLAARGTTVYAGTSRWGGLGARPTTASATVFAYDTAARRTAWKVVPVEGAQSISSVLIGPSGRLWVACGSTLLELDPESGHTIRTVKLAERPQADAPTYATTDLAYSGGYLYFAADGNLLRIDPGTLSVTVIQSDEVYPPRLQIVNGALYYPSGSRLMKATPR